jgi:hypothetical protein
MSDLLFFCVISFIAVDERVDIEDGHPDNLKSLDEK